MKKVLGKTLAVIGIGVLTSVHPSPKSKGCNAVIVEYYYKKGVLIHSENWGTSVEEKSAVGFWVEGRRVEADSTITRIEYIK